MRFDTKYLPLWLQNMQQMDELLTAESKELDRLHNALEEYIRELSLSTANDLLARSNTGREKKELDCETQCTIYSIETKYI